MYAQARRVAVAAGHTFPEQPFPIAVRASLFNRTPNRDVDGALGVHERRVEAARRCAAAARGLEGDDDAAEDGRERE
eukprot:15412096-Alexandrium_andersonii.AAC.1